MKYSCKKALILTLLFVFTVILFTGCGSTGSVEDTSSAPDTTPEPTVEAVDLGGTQVQSDCRELSLNDGDYSFEALLRNVGSLHSLERISLGTTSLSASQLAELSAATDARLDYSVSFNGSIYARDTSELDLTALEPAYLDDAEELLFKLPMVERVILSADGVENRLSADEAIALHSAAPEAEFDYSFEYFSQMISLSDETVEYKNAAMDNSSADFFAGLLPAMPQCRRLVLDDCGIDYEVMAQLRDSFPDKEIVWRVHFDMFSCLTDVEMLRAVSVVSDSGGVADLKYCTEVKYIDFGHNEMLSNIEFLSYMPHLKILILGDCIAPSLEPLASCTELELLEIPNCYLITDLSPLENCKNLRFLNFSNLIDCKDITPLYGLTKLERLFASRVYAPEEQQDEIKEKLPDCWVTFGIPEPTRVSYNYSIGWRLDAGPNETADWYDELREIFHVSDEYYSYNHSEYMPVDEESLVIFGS